MASLFFFNLIGLTMLINLIWSTDPNGYIGRGNELIFKNSADLIRFKNLTSGSQMAVLMGRKTFESIGSKPLPNRVNIILSKILPESSIEPSENLYLCKSINSALKRLRELNIEVLWVIGGKEIYEQFFELADSLYITQFSQYAEYSDDLVQYLPDLNQFKLVNVIELTSIDEQQVWRRIE